jgi:hypothetical protein
MMIVFISATGFGNLHGIHDSILKWGKGHKHHPALHVNSDGKACAQQDFDGNM